MRQQIVGHVAGPEAPREVERRLAVARLRIHIGSRCYQCLNAIEARKLGGGMNNCITIEDGIGIGTLLQQQIYQLNSAFCHSRQQGGAKIRFGIDIGTALDKQLGRGKVPPPDCGIKGRCRPSFSLTSAPASRAAVIAATSPFLAAS